MIFGMSPGRTFGITGCRETDPAHLQPPVRPLNHRVAEFIRKYALRDVPADRVELALDILESPWPRREETMLRTWFNSDMQSGSSLASDLIEKILQTGLEPTVPPEPLPPIEQEDIELYCWMGMESESS